MNEHILLVEDNENNRYLVTFLLEQAGARVSHARDGAGAIELASELGPDLILMDIQMPKMDGYEAAREILSDPCLAGIPLVAVTSYAMSGDRERAMRMGFRGYIEKPINPDTFVAEVRTFLNRQKPSP